MLRVIFRPPPDCGGCERRCRDREGNAPEPALVWRLTVERVPGFPYLFLFGGGGRLVKGAIFDMDGVLVDNAPFHIQAWQQLGRELGEELRAQDIRTVFGHRNREMLAALIGRPFSEEELDRLTAHKEEIYRSIIEPVLAPTPGLVEFLDQLVKLGLRTAVATSGPMENVSLVLEKLNLSPYFEAIATGGEVAQAKPAPDVFLLAAERLNLLPQECVVFEDSTAGIEAARRAGCACIALSTTHPIEELAHTSALKIVPDFRSVEIADLQRR